MFSLQPCFITFQPLLGNEITSQEAERKRNKDLVARVKELAPQGSLPHFRCDLFNDRQTFCQWKKNRKASCGILETNSLVVAYAHKKYIKYWSATGGFAPVVSDISTSRALNCKWISAINCFKCMAGKRIETYRKSFKGSKRMGFLHFCY